MMNDKNDTGNNGVEHWDAGGGHSFLYTENPNLAKMLVKNFGKATIYFRHQYIVAWQARVPTRVLPLILKTTTNDSRLFEKVT